MQHETLRTQAPKAQAQILSHNIISFPIPAVQPRPPNPINPKYPYRNPCHDLATWAKFQVASKRDNYTNSNPHKAGFETQNIHRNTKTKPLCWPIYVPAAEISPNKLALGTVKQGLEP